MAKGTSPEYGARELKRAIHKYLTQPLATLVIESKIQPGSTVRVALEKEDGLTFETTSRERRVIARPPTVLVVDDNQDFLRLLSLELAAETSWHVSTAQSVAEAEAISSSHAIDFALLDLLLPDGNGIALGAKLVEQQPGTRVAIMTGADLLWVEGDECRKRQFDIVQKPFLPRQIIHLVGERVKSQAMASA